MKYNIQVASEDCSSFRPISLDVELSTASASPSASLLGTCSIMLTQLSHRHPIKSASSFLTRRS